MTRAEMLERISSEELSEWMQFFEEEPFGGQQDEWRAGLIASTIANANRAKKSDHLFKPADFMRQLFQDDEEKEAPEEDVLVKKILGVFGAMGAKLPNGNIGKTGSQIDR